MDAQSVAEPRAPRPAALLDLPVQIQSVAAMVANGTDLLNTVPREVRLQIFEHLLTTGDVIYYGAGDFGRLDESEFRGNHASCGSSNGHASITWGILLTCRLYYLEATPIMYRNNKFVFCTGREGIAGMFQRFPIKTHYMHHLSHLGVFFCADNPRAQSSIRVALFIKALARHARSLQSLEILIDSVQPWNMLFYGHPVTEAIENLVRARNVRQLLLRFHNGTRVYAPWADYIHQVFTFSGQPAESTLEFAVSCACTSPVTNPKCWMQHPGFAVHAALPGSSPWTTHVPPDFVQAGQTFMMDVQDDLLEYGLVNDEDDYGYGKHGLAYARWDRLAGLRQSKITDYFIHGGRA